MKQVKTETGMEKGRANRTALMLGTALLMVAVLIPAAWAADLLDPNMCSDGQILYKNGNTWQCMTLEARSGQMSRPLAAYAGEDIWVDDPTAPIYLKGYAEGGQGSYVFKWTADDGTIISYGSPVVTLPIPTEPGVFRYRLEVEDMAGTTASDEVDVVVDPRYVNDDARYESNNTPETAAMLPAEDSVLYLVACEDDYYTVPFVGKGRLHLDVITLDDTPVEYEYEESGVTTLVYETSASFDKVTDQNWVRIGPPTEECVPYILMIRIEPLAVGF